MILTGMHFQRSLWLEVYQAQYRKRVAAADTFAQAQYR